MLNTMTEQDYKKDKQKAKRKPFSKFAVFNGEVSGYKFTTESGQPIYKWELFIQGYKPTDLIYNRTNIIAKLK